MSSIVNNAESSKGLGAGLLVAGALVALIVASRLMIDVPNFAAAGAAALFAGFVLRSRVLALAVPVVGMLISDAVIGFYSPLQMAGVYLSLAVSVALGMLVQRRGAGLLTVMGAGLAGSVFFFLATNLMVYLSGSMYAHDLGGLARCYVLALPFFRYTVMSDGLFIGLLFGACAVIRALKAREALITA